MSGFHLSSLLLTPLVLKPSHPYPWSEREPASLEAPGKESWYTELYNLKVERRNFIRIPSSTGTTLKPNSLQTLSGLAKKWQSDKNQMNKQINNPDTQNPQCIC